MENPEGMVDQIDNISLDAFFGRARDADWFVQGNIDIVTGYEKLVAVYANIIPRLDLAADCCPLSIDRYTPLRNQLVGASSGGLAGFTYKFINTHVDTSLIQIYFVPYLVEKHLGGQVTINKK
jgi:hypothetical protein